MSPNGTPNAEGKVDDHVGNTNLNDAFTCARQPSCSG